MDPAAMPDGMGAMTATEFGDIAARKLSPFPRLSASLFPFTTALHTFSAA